MQDRTEDLTLNEFKTDVMGSVLRYLILIHDSKVLGVLYNTGNSIEQLRAREIRVDTDKMYEL